MGWDGVHEFGEHGVRVRLMPNPSHLEFVNPVVMGMARAAQDDTMQPGGAPTLDLSARAPGGRPRRRRLPRSGRGGGDAEHVVPLRLHGRRHDPRDREQPGRLHDEPERARSTSYASDLAKGFEIPVVHVNADDVEACLAVARLAQEYRHRFRKDFVIDLIGYRRWGHNEGDEPALHAAADVRDHPLAPDGARDLGGAPGRGGGGHRGGGGGDAAGGVRPAGGAGGLAQDEPRSRSSEALAERARVANGRAGDRRCRPRR
jgi:2-oxoglutarate dehydrogenase E1 component